MPFSRRSFILGASAALAAPAIVKAESLMKIAVIREQALPFLPCDGRLISRTTYAELFKVIGTSYGAGDGRTTFALPDATCRVLDYLAESGSFTSRSGNAWQVVTKRVDEFYRLPGTLMQSYGRDDLNQPIEEITQLLRVNNGHYFRN